MNRAQAAAFAALTAHLPGDAPQPRRHRRHPPRRRRGTSTSSAPASASTAAGPSPTPARSSASSLPVIQVRDVAAGESVGYGAAWTAPRPSRIATVAAGYADGLARALGGGHLALFAGETAVPLVGRVSMDLVTVDVTGL